MDGADIILSNPESQNMTASNKTKGGIRVFIVAAKRGEGEHISSHNANPQDSMEPQSCMY